MIVINAYTTRAVRAGPAALHPRLAPLAISRSTRGGSHWALPACTDTFCTEAANMGAMVMQEDYILTSSSSNIIFLFVSLLRLAKVLTENDFPA